MRILLIEDDTQLGETIRKAIKAHYQIDWVQNIQHATHAIHDELYDLAILDWNLPDGSGVKLLQSWRATGKVLPVMLLTARSQSDDKVYGLDSGADDFLTKPFDLDVFLARIRALLRRRSVPIRSQITCGDLFLNLDNYSLSKQGQSIDLSKLEFDIIRVLMEKKHQYVSKAHLEKRLYDWDKIVTPNAIEAQISRLRKKVGKEYITTKRGIGYRVHTPSDS